MPQISVSRGRPRCRKRTTLDRDDWRMKRKSLTAFLLAAGLMIGAASATAHAIITRAQPAPGSSVAGAKVSIAPQYNSRIGGRRSHLVLHLPDGTKRARAPSPQTALARPPASARG